MHKTIDIVGILNYNIIKVKNIYLRGYSNVSKLKLYLDCDDTITNSSETVVKIICKRYGINKTIKDLKDFEYKSIYKNITTEEVINIYESDEFWETVDLKDDFKSVKDQLKELFDINIVTCGTEINFKKKKCFIDRHLDVPMIGISIHKEKRFDKSEIDMLSGIQIDDNHKCLQTNASIKVLLKDFRINNLHKEFVEAGEENMYVVRDWFELLQLLKFFNTHREFIEDI